MKTKNNLIIFGNTWLSIADIIHIAQDNYQVAINNDLKFLSRINSGVQFLADKLKKDGKIYGVTTGYGDSCTTAIPPHLVDQLPLHLVRFHGCGLGRYFDHQQARAIMAVRLCSLAKGFSAARSELMQRIVDLLNYDIAPLIPEEGSVGASGDLTPLSYLAAVLIGERDVSYRGEQKSTAAVFELLNIEPLTLLPKEALALMNGTAVMTALACAAWQRTAYLCKLAARLTAMSSLALHGNADHYDARLFAVKPHAGQAEVAAWINADLNGVHSSHQQHNHNQQQSNQSHVIQDCYSLRCAPHVIGVVQDSLPWFKQMIENEINSANDNPIIDGEKEFILHGGHFYGGHIATVMDTMKVQVANLADLLDRQMALLVNPKFNRGLPANLSYATKERAAINHGFKAVQIAVSAWTAEALKNTMPASVFSRSTECHNQDKVSMGTIAARDCLRVLELTEQVFAAHILATTQALSIRTKQQELERAAISPAIAAMMNDILDNFIILTEDRQLDTTLRQFVQYIKQQRWKMHEL